VTQEPPDKRKKLHIYLKYSGMALQFFALLAIGAWLGQKLDAHFGTSKPFITIFLILFLAGGYFYKMYRDLTSE
jgi:F0F1-type ATP synthase assembly protein I